MTQRKILALVLGIPFTALTVYAVMQVGYVGIFDYHRHSPAGWQVFADLVVALALVISWMLVDARKSGRNVWPYVVATLFLGSLGPLAYLLMSPSTDEKSTEAIRRHQTA